MPHAIDFDELEEKLFLIEQLAAASKRYCFQKNLNQESSNWLDYSARLKSAVSNYSIECAIKTRVVQDYFIDYEYQDIDLVEIEQSATEGIYLGQVEDGTFKVNLRECCNKIIHTQEAGLIWVHDERGIDYWSGAIRLEGKHRKAQWVLLLELNNWAQALRNFHEELNGTVDWMAVWDYDN